MRTATWHNYSFEEMKKIAEHEEELHTIKVCITPELAVEILEHNVVREDGVVGNRAINNAVVTNYVTQMMHGEWYTTKESISFNPNMQLLDGQHRLTAIAKSGISRNMLVVLNCTSNFGDVGRSRKDKDSILMIDPSIPANILDKRVMSAIRYYISNNKSRLGIYGDGGMTKFVSENMRTLIKTKLTLDTAIHNSGINCKGTRLVNPAMYFFTFVLLKDYSDIVTQNDIDEFLEVYLNGRLSDERRTDGSIIMHDAETGKDITFNGSATIQNYENLIRPILFCRDDILSTVESCSNYNFRKYITNRLFAAMYDYKRVKKTGVQLVRKSRDCQRGNPKYLATKFAVNNSPYVYSTEIMYTGTVDIKKKTITKKMRSEIIELFNGGNSIEQISIIVGIDRNRVRNCCESI